MPQNSTQDRYMEAFIRNFIFVLFGIIINSINGMFVFAFFKSSIFYNDPRYILYIHLVINDMLMVFFSITLSVMAYAWLKVPFLFCVTFLIISSTAHKNTPLTLAGMAVERYIAICKPLHHHQIWTTAYRTTTGSAPSYFHSLLRIYIPSRSLRSASERRLVVPSQRGSKSLSRTFSFTIPGWWNNLPTPIRNAGSLSIFKQQLKTHLFRHYLTSS